MVNCAVEPHKNARRNVPLTLVENQTPIKVKSVGLLLATLAATIV